MKQLLLSAIFTAMILLFSSCASTSKTSVPENMFIPEDFAGIVHAGHTGTEEELTHLNYLGADWVLHTFNWNRIEAVQGEWNFDYYDEIVNNTAAVGIKVLGILAYDVGWIHEDGKDRKYIPPQKIPDFLQYVRMTVEHFQGRIGAWCIWNEPNFFFWDGTDDEFVELSRQTADAVREVDNEVILLGGAFNRGVFGLPEKFIRKLFESGAMDKVDGVAFHPYELNPSRSALLYERFRKIVDDYGFGNKIWITEAGYPTGGWYPTKVREDRFPEYVLKTMVLLAKRGAQKILWYQLFDPVERPKNDSENFFGLVRSRQDYTSKGAEAFRLCAQFLSGSYCYALEPGAGLPKSIRSFWFKGTGRNALVLWNDGLGSRRINVRLSGTDHASHDAVSGIESPIQPDTVITVGRTPVFITWNGSEDRPVIEAYK